MSIESELRDGKIQQMTHEQIANCPFSIMVPSHYNADGSCKCFDREAAIMKEWGYSWDDGKNQWTTGEDEL